MASRDGTLRIAPVDGRSDLLRFFRFPRVVYRGDRCWVEPILADRLAKWTQGGQFGFLFDNSEDTISFSRFQCFDFQRMSQYAEILEPLLFYILHRANSVIADRQASTTFTVAPGSALPLTLLPSSDTVTPVAAPGAVVSGAVTVVPELELPPLGPRTTTVTLSPLLSGGLTGIWKLPLPSTGAL